MLLRFSGVAGEEPGNLRRRVAILSGVHDDVGPQLEGRVHILEQRICCLGLLLMASILLYPREIILNFIDCAKIGFLMGDDPVGGRLRRCPGGSRPRRFQGINLARIG